MKTTNCKKVHLLDELLEIMDKLKALREREEEIKAWAKVNIGPGKSLETENVLCFVEAKERASIDRALLEAKLGAEKIKAFENVTKFLQVNIKKKGGAK